MIKSCFCCASLALLSLAVPAQTRLTTVAVGGERQPPDSRIGRE